MSSRGYKASGFKKTRATTASRSLVRQAIYAQRRATAVAGATRKSGYYGRFGKGGELKFLDTTLATNTAIPAAGVVHPNLVVVPQGDGQSERTGRKIVVKKIQIRGEFTTTATDVGDGVRILIVQDMQANGAVFTTANVLQTADWRSWINLENSDRFKVLYDNTTKLYPGPFDGVDQTQVITPFKVLKKCSIPIIYDSSATTGAIGTQRSNSIAVLAISLNNNLSGLGYIARIRYEDD